MLTARAKRKENIAEYILYIWQLEDLFRALQFSPEAIYAQLVKPLQIGEDEKQDVFFWYMDLVHLLRTQGKAQHGHIDHTLHLIRDLDDLHRDLLRLPAGEEYRKVFAPLAAELPVLKARLEKRDMSDIEFCMRALYAVMLYRIKGDETHKAYENDVMTLISPVIAQLARIHREIEKGEFDLYKGEKQTT